MGLILKLLEDAGIHGAHMTSGNSAVRCCRPIYATFVGDYPEQCLVAGVKNGECPSCTVAHDDLGDIDAVLEPRHLEDILEALDSISQGGTAFTKACKLAGIKPIQHPFWAFLPYVNIYQCIAPDILHQVLNGIMKHLIAWIKAAIGQAKIDVHCHRFPPNHHIWLFMKGICNLSRVTGTEHEQICQFLLGPIIGTQLPNNLSPA